MKVLLTGVSKCVAVYSFVVHFSMILISHMRFFASFVSLIPTRISPVMEEIPHDKALMPKSVRYKRGKRDIKIRVYLNVSLYRTLRDIWIIPPT